MVVPTPTALPCTAATSGFSQRASAWRKRMIGAPSPALSPVILTKSPISLPAQNTVGAPAIRMQRSAVFFTALSVASVMASYIAKVSAFFLSGRFIRTVRTGPSSLTRTRSLIESRLRAVDTFGPFGDATFEAGCLHRDVFGKKTRQGSARRAIAVAQTSQCLVRQHGKTGSIAE